VQYVQCTRCGLVHQAGDAVKAADPAFYQELYRKVYQSNERPISKDLKIQEMRAHHLCSLLPANPVPRVCRSLDIGASAGVLLDAYREFFACDTVGVEPGTAYREYAAEKGHTMVPALEDLLAQNPEPFQLVSLIHVVEHLENPVDMLRSIHHSLLSPDGLLLIEVPNFYAHDSYELAHLACYTPHTLHQLLRQAGFEVILSKTHGVPRSEKLGLYLLVLAKPVVSAGNPPLEAEKNVKLKRKAAMLWRRLVQKVFPNSTWLPLPQ
jgi:2-polyprenyl-3-methyl-5-hydroxy-6-metoxy-1,4-benzoquinol methylase